MIERAEEMVTPDGEMAAEEIETSDLPMSILAGAEVSPGDTVRLEVVEVDADNGVVRVKYAHPKKKEPVGIEAMTAAFD